MNLTRHHGKHLQSLRRTSGTAKPQAKCPPPPHRCLSTVPPPPFSKSTPLPQNTHTHQSLCTHTHTHTLTSVGVHTQPAVSSSPRAFPPPAAPPQDDKQDTRLAPPTTHTHTHTHSHTHLAPQTQDAAGWKMEDVECRLCVPRVPAPL